MALVRGKQVPILSSKRAGRGTHGTTGPTVLETISRHVKDKKVLRSSQHGFTKGRSCLTDLMAFYKEMSSLEDKGRAVGTACLLSTTF